MKKLSKITSGIAGVYSAAAELSKQGYIASITLRNTKGIADFLRITNISNDKLNNQILLVNKEIFKSRDYLTDFERRRLSLIERSRSNLLNRIIPHPLAYVIIFIPFFVCPYIFICYINLVNHLI